MSEPAVVVDIDSTLADTFHRSHMILQGDQREDTDWVAYAKACGGDTPTGTVDLLRLLDPYYTIVLMTSRPGAARDETVEWLTRYRVPYDVLIMDYKHAPSTVDFKVEQIRELIRSGWDVRLLLEDNWKIGEAVKAELGVPSVIVRSYAPNKLELSF